MYRVRGGGGGTRDAPGHVLLGDADQQVCCRGPQAACGVAAMRLESRGRTPPGVSVYVQSGRTLCHDPLGRAHSADELCDIQNQVQRSMMYMHRWEQELSQK